jgi:hypothetical protein
LNRDCYCMSEARPRCEGNHTAMRWRISYPDEQKEADCKIQAHHHGIARIGMNWVTQTANQRKNGGRKE